MASTQVSVAEARPKVARLARRAEDGNAIGITRHEERLAVLPPASEHAAITGEPPSFIEAARQVRSSMGGEKRRIGEADFDGLRDRSPGREIAL